MHQTVGATVYYLLENYLKFWRITTNVTGYIKDVIDLKEQLLPRGLVLRKVRLITSILLAQLLHLFALLFFDGCLTDFQKLIFYDISLLMHCPGNINYLLVACTLNELYYFSVLYGPASFSERKFWWPILLSNDVLFNREQQFFLSKVWERKKFGSGSGRSLPVEVAVRRYTGYWMLALRYFVAFIVFLLIVFQLESFVYLYLFRAEVFPLFDRPFMVLLNLLSYAATNFLFYANMGCLIYTLFVASILFLSLSLIIFIQLQQVDRLIEGDEEVGFQATTFMRYRKHHAKVLQLTLFANDIYGRLLFAFFAIFVPLNTYLIISMLQGQYTAVGTFILTNCVVFQFSGMIGFHLLAIQYSYRLHSSNRVLLHWTAQPPNRRHFGMTVSTRLMLANYALNMHRDPSDRFGITYGCLGLMTWATFGNCVFFYLQFMLYWYKLFEQGAAKE